MRTPLRTRTTCVSPVVRTMVTDPLGHATTYRFNPGGALLDVTDANGQTVTFTLDSGSGRYQSRTGTAGCTLCGTAGIGDQTYEYDAQGRLTKLTDALGESTAFTYPAVGEIPDSVTDALQRTTAFAQNAVGDVTDITDPAGKVWHLDYDFGGRLLALTDPNHHTTSFTYGATGRPETIVDPPAAPPASPTTQPEGSPAPRRRTVRPSMSPTMRSTASPASRMHSAFSPDSPTIR